MGADEAPLFVVERAREADLGPAGAPAADDLYCVRGATRALIADDLAVGEGRLAGRAVSFGYGVDVWDVGDRLLARVADGWSETETGEGERRERFFISEDAGAAWAEIGSADARDLEHRRTEERLVARIDGWPGGWC